MKRIILNFLTSIIFAFPCTVFAQWTPAGTLSGTYYGVFISVVDSNTVWACASGNNFSKIWRTVNGGLNWIDINVNGLPPHGLTVIRARDSLTAFLGDGGSNLYSGGNAYISKTTNGGTNWITVDTTGGQFGYINGIEFSKNNPDEGFIMSDAPQGPGNLFVTWKTSNGGQTWSRNTIPGIYNSTGLQSGVFCFDSLFYGFLTLNVNYDTSKINFTTNGGTNWILKSTNPSYGTTCCGNCDFKSDGTTGIFVVSGMLPNIAKTTDHALNWEIKNTGINGTGRSVMRWINGTNQVFLTAQISPTGNYVFRSNDNGEIWKPQSTPALMSGISDASFIRNGSRIYGYVITLTGYVFKTSQDTTVIGIHKISNEVPSQFFLYQNYPNPFNPKSKIKYEITNIEGKNQKVELPIYNVLGETIVTLVNEKQSAGTYEVDWDASDYPSGVYYYQLTVTSERLVVFKETKKMVLVK